MLSVGKRGNVCILDIILNKKLKQLVTIGRRSQLVNMIWATVKLSGFESWLHHQLTWCDLQDPSVPHFPHLQHTDDVSTCLARIP